MDETVSDPQLTSEVSSAADEPHAVTADVVDEVMTEEVVAHESVEPVTAEVVGEEGVKEESVAYVQADEPPVADMGAQEYAFYPSISRSESLSVPPVEDPLVSRAGRKRKINSRYLDEPSPVHKPAPVRRVSAPAKTAPAPSPPTAPKKEEEPAPVPLVTGPPTFSSLLFGGRTRKLSESLSDADWAEEDEDPLPSIESSDDDQPSGQTTGRAATVGVSVAAHAGPGVDMSTEDKASDSAVRLEGEYTASGAAGPVPAEWSGKVVLVPPPAESGLKFPDLSSLETQAVLFGNRGRLGGCMTALGGGGVLSLLPNAPVQWFRDEVPKLSAYFRKKLEVTGSTQGSKHQQHSVSAPGEKRAASVALSEAQRAERKRQKEEERKRVIEERNRRKERERLKQLYRQHWLALTKFPIEDDLLHSRKGVRRLGHSAPACRVIAAPVVYWDCRLGPPGTLAVPSDFPPALLDEVFVIWNFITHFGPHLMGPDLAAISLAELVEALLKRDLTPLVSKIHWALIQLLRPWVEYMVTTLLLAEQNLESQLTKNRGRAKMFWNSICQFRDFLFLGYSVWVANSDISSSGEGTGATWMWLSLYVAKCAVLLEAVDYRTKEFLNTISSTFEEIEFEHKWLFDWEQRASWTYADTPFATRVKLLKLLVDKAVSLPVMKKAVDLVTEARTHVHAELAMIDKEERKFAQRITLGHRLQAIVAESGGETVDVAQAQFPTTADDLESETRTREALLHAKRVASMFSAKNLEVRIESLGRDRHLNEYFQVSGMRQVVFVRQRLGAGSSEVRYGVYDSLANLEILIRSLDERGVREHALKAELQKVKANVYSEMVLKGESDWATTSIDWLREDAGLEEVRGMEGGLSKLQDDARGGVVQVKYVSECIRSAQGGLTTLRNVWSGSAGVNGDDVDDDDVTVDENMESDDESDQSEQGSSSTKAGGWNPPAFATEKDSLFASIMRLSSVITEALRVSLLSYPKVGETSSTTTSVLVQFHIKTGNDLLRQLSIPVDMHDFSRCIQISGARTQAMVASLFADGLVGLDEVVHDELARHDSPTNVVEVWPNSGGEKFAWKKFLGVSDQPAGPSSPEGEEDPSATEEGAAAETATTNASFPCDGCGKKFKFHILLGIHKLHPCKTRGRKPIPLDPVMEAFPVSESNGMLSIDRITLPEFPPMPSSRQEAAEKVGTNGGSLLENGGTEYVCDICGKSFPHNQGLAVHQTRWCIPEQQAQLIQSAQQAVGGMNAAAGANASGVGGEAPVNCPICGKMFPTIQGLVIHQNRWCKGGDEDKTTPGGDMKAEEESLGKGLRVEPVFRRPPVDADAIVQMLPEESGSAEGEATREPGVTPAGSSLAGLTVAIMWFCAKLESATNKFTSAQASRVSKSAKPKK